MPTQDTSYEYIKTKISAYKETYPSLRDKTDDYVFSAVAVKSNYYKNPAIDFNESDFDEMIVDGQYDGGVDILLTDPNSETSDLVIAQSKFYTHITMEDVVNALTKMGLFYKEMQQGHYESVNQKVQRRFLSLNSEVGDESKIHFVLYTSAPKSGIRKDRVIKKFREQFSDSSQFEIDILFGADIEEEIKESESRRPTVENGKIAIDAANNVLAYGEDAVIVNVSAFSIKQLYAEHNTNLLSRNLRYHIAGRDIDKAIEETIQNDPEQFWLRNNGITIICDEFNVSSKVVHLKNFSIVNGGQTTYMLHKSSGISEQNDLFLPCKIIRVMGETEDEKNAFSLAIAKATNSQKAIKQVDLKANAPEQVRFGQAMRECGIFYQTKRGEVVPKSFKQKHLNTDLAAVGKLCLAGVFQVPCTSRSKPSSLYADKYYNPVFNGNQSQIARLCQELLYVDNYFRTQYQKKFDAANVDAPNSNERIAFAHNSRTICIAFIAFASRYYQNNITDSDMQVVSGAAQSDVMPDSIYDIFSNIEDIGYFVPNDVFNDKDKYESILDELFNLIIEAGIRCYTMAKRYDNTLNATNYLKKDKNYYVILSDNWPTLSAKVKEILSQYM